MSLPATIQGVVFDVDGTLYHQAPLRRAMALRLLAAHAVHPIRGRRVMRALSAYRRAQEDLRAAEPGTDLAAQQIAVAADVSGVPATEVQDLVERWMESAPLPLLPRVARSGLRPALERLRRHGLRLAVLSDYPADRKLQALGIADLFDVVLCAQDPSIGAFKPNPRGIEVALQCLGVPAHAAVYVGDRIEVDGAAAKAAQVACVIVGDGAAQPVDGIVAVADFDRLASILGALQ